MSQYSFMKKTFAFPDAKNPSVEREVTVSLEDGVTTYMIEWYETACTAEYVMDNFAELLENTNFNASKIKDLAKHLTEDIAMNIAAEVRRRMRKF